MYKNAARIAPRIVTDVNDEQPEKAYAPICVTPLGIVTDVNDLQPSKAP